MERKPQLLENLIDITPINAPTFIDAQNARDSDIFERIVVIINAPNVSYGDQDIPPPIVLSNKKGTISNGRKSGKSHQ